MDEKELPAGAPATPPGMPSEDEMAPTPEPEAAGGGYVGSTGSFDSQPGTTPSNENPYDNPPPLPETPVINEELPEELQKRPASKQGGRRILLLLALTLVLVGVLIGAVWYFFLRPTPSGQSRPTPTPTASPDELATISPTGTPGASTTHLECRFGLCVEVPGEGENQCTSSFDCEQVSITPTEKPPSPTPTGSTVVEPTSAVSPTNTPTPQGVQLPTATTTPRPTSTVLPTATLTPTPLANELPESGTLENTFVFMLLVTLTLGAGWLLALRKI